MSFQVFSLGAGRPGGGPQSEALGLGEIDLGVTSAQELAEDIAGHGGGLIGVWHSRRWDADDYLVVEGEFDRADASEVAADVGLALVDFRRIIVLESGERADDVRDRLETLNIGPETNACTECGGYNGLHFSPPH